MANSPAFVVKASSHYCLHAPELSYSWKQLSPIQDCFCAALFEQGAQMGFLPQGHFNQALTSLFD